MSLELLLIASLWIYGFNFLMVDERSIFSWWYDYLDLDGSKLKDLYLLKVLPKWLSKPTFNCVMCMASVHGTLIYWVFQPEPSIVGWVAFCVSLCGLNYIISEIIWRD